MKAAFKRSALVGVAIALSAGLAAGPRAYADSNMGYVSFDTITSNTAAFDIVNATGPNSSGDANFPVTTPVSFSNLSLTVFFTSGPSETFGPAYFTLNADGLSWNGTPESTLVGPPGGFDGAVSATLTGTFDTTALTLFDGSTETINPTFSATFTDPTGGPLTDGDFAIIVATTGSAVPPTVPEPESLLLVGTGIGMLASLRRRRIASWLVGKAAAICPILLVGCVALLIPGSASAATKLAGTWTVPDSGEAGVNFVTLTANGLPSGTISAGSVTVYLAHTCTTTGATTTAVTQVTPLLPGTDRMQFELPGSLGNGTYFVQISGTTTGGTTFASTNCVEVNVTAITTSGAACVPTSSLAVTIGANVDAYVPFGYWESSTLGLARVPLEGSDTAKTFTTPGPVNSCAANPITGEVVCTENGTTVDLINGSTLTSVTSGSNTTAGFSGGACQNCGVGVHSGENGAVIAMGYSSGTGTNTGVQFLNLASNSFPNAPVALANQVSEDISIDSGRGLILSPGEDGVYDLLKLGTGNSITEFGNYIGGTLDSAAEDCTTGIGLASDEFTDQIYITDLTQATFTSGSPAGTWTAPGQFVNLSDSGYSAGTCGISVAPGTNHQGVVTGEFGGQAYSALQLPSTSGSGTPTLADWAYVGSMPTLPNGSGFQAGFDPHTVTAYTSPNTGKSYAVFADYGATSPSGGPGYVGVVDLACVLTQPRSSTHIVAGDASTCTRYVALP